MLNTKRASWFLIHRDRGRERHLFHDCADAREPLIFRDRDDARDRGRDLHHRGGDGRDRGGGRGGDVRLWLAYQV